MDIELKIPLEQNVQNFYEIIADTYSQNFIIEG